jgi:hypothetical protein
VSATDDIVLQVAGLMKSKEHGKDNRNICRALVLNNVSFTVTRGASFLVVGGAASGKTSLIAAIDPGNSSEFRSDYVRFAEDAIVKGATDSRNLAQQFHELNRSCVVLKDGFQFEKDNHQEMLRCVWEAGATMIASTEIHRLDHWSGEFDSLLLLVEGEVRFSGTAEALIAEVRRGDCLSSVGSEDAGVLRRWADDSSTVH